VAASELAYAAEPTGRESPLRSRLPSATRGALWILGAAAGIGLTALPASRDSLASHPTDFVLVVALGWSFIFCGLIVWKRWPIAGPGTLMVGVGFVWFAARLATRAGWSPVYTAGMWLGDLWFAVFTVFIVSFPRFAPKARTDWLLAGPFLFVMGPLEFVWLLFYDPGPGTPGSDLLVWRNPDVASALDLSQRCLLVAGSIILTAALGRRWLSATAPRRRTLTPVLVGACGVLLSSSLTILARYGGSPHSLQLVVVATWAIVPLGVLIDVLRARLARSSVADLVVALSANPAPSQLRDALARALGDPRLRLGFWLPEFATYADPDGHRVALEPDADQATTIVERGRGPVAALVHDAALRGQPELLDGVVAAAGIALENARLQSELRAQLEELKASRARIVEATQAERQRLERDLHDGAQQRLVTLSLELGLLETELADPAAKQTLKQMRDTLTESLQELRELAHGIHPDVVTRRGLAIALEALVERAPIPVWLNCDLDDRLPEQLEVAAYYVASEALTNIAKHAHASAATIHVKRATNAVEIEITDDGVGGAKLHHGSGLRGLADRVEVLGGSLQVVSNPGEGTRLQVTIPTEQPPQGSREQPRTQAAPGSHGDANSDEARLRSRR